MKRCFVISMIFFVMIIPAMVSAEDITNTPTPVFTETTIPISNIPTTYFPTETTLEIPTQDPTPQPTQTEQSIFDIIYNMVVPTQVPSNPTYNSLGASAQVVCGESGNTKIVLQKEPLVVGNVTDADFFGSEVPVLLDGNVLVVETNYSSDRINLRIETEDLIYIIRREK